MRKLLLICFVAVGFLAFSQISLAEPDSAVLIEDSLEIELLFDSIPTFNYFDPSLIKKHQSRIAAVQNLTVQKDGYFFAIIFFSLILVLAFVNSKEIVKSSLNSIRSLQNTMQFSRTEKQSNGFYFVSYLGIFVIGVSILIHYVGNELYFLDYTFPRIILFVVIFFFMDYYMSYIYLLFTTNSRSIEMAQTVILTYPILLSFMLWPALFFVILSTLATAKIVLIILMIALLVIFILKEIRTMQVLWIEKIDIFSFHFFAYLCTFKFLPILILAKIFF